MKHLKTLLLVFALLFSVNTLMAQEKYDYAAILFDAAKVELCISINGSSYEKPKLPKEASKEKYRDFNPVLKQLNEMNDEGWEVYSVLNLSGSPSYLYNLRRKEQ